MGEGHPSFCLPAGLRGCRWGWGLRIRAGLALLLHLLSPGPALQSPADGSPEEAPPIIRETIVVRPGEDGFNCMFPPTLLVTPRYLMVFGESRVYGGGHGAPGDVVIGQKQSTDNGASWSPLTIPFNDTRRTRSVCGYLGCSVGQPAPVWDELRQRIVMAYTIDNLHAMVSFSRGQDVASFGQSLNLSSVVKAKPKIFVGTGPGGAIQMSSGRLLVGTYFTDLNISADKTPPLYGLLASSCFVLYSDDGGIVWKKGATVPTSAKVGECMLAVLGNSGREHIGKGGHQQLVMYMRDDSYGTQHSGGRDLALSDNGGLSWRTVRIDIPSLRPSTAVQGDILGVPYPFPSSSSTALLVSDPRNNHTRSNLTISISRDGGVSFRPLLFLYQHNASYSSLRLSRDGKTVFCVFDSGPEHDTTRLASWSLYG